MILFALVAVLTELRVALLVLTPLQLYPDEAQYWYWSLHPAFGYYAKPPVVAWLIALTTGLFGDSELAVRLAAPLVAPGGMLFAASCSHHVDAAMFAEEVRRGLTDARRSGRILFAGGAGPDHPVHPFLPESAYLKFQPLQLD